jgi:hypothetical protein
MAQRSSRCQNKSGTASINLYIKIIGTYKYRKMKFLSHADDASIGRLYMYKWDVFDQQ